ncbi:Disp1 [Symbiodinium microadriaticum]|nr:Disp1 [Symbiodinium microadriaticum]
MANLVGEAVNVDANQSAPVVGVPVQSKVVDSGKPKAEVPPCCCGPDPCCWENCLIGTCFGCCGPCVPCWSFFLLGWLFTVLFVREIGVQGTDIFSFEDPAVETDIRVQQWFGYQAALSERPGCFDQAHEDEDVCKADELCEWVTRGPRGSCQELECPSAPPKVRESPLYLDFLPAFISVIYEAVEENGNILDDDVMQIIKNYEAELFTDVDGAEYTYNGAKRPSPWNEDWCLMAYPSHGFGTPKCASGVGLTHMFSMDTDGLNKVAQQGLDGMNFLGLGGMMACICHMEDTCQVCNSDGTMKAAGTWPTSIQTCIANWKSNVLSMAQAQANEPTTTTTTLDPTSALGQLCAAAPTRSPLPTTSGPVSMMALDRVEQAMMQTVAAGCASNMTCGWSPPGTHQICSSSAYFPATDATGLVTGAAKEAILDKMCDPSLPLWWNSKNSFMPISFDCESRKSKYALSRFFAGANDPEDDKEGERFQLGYVEGRTGWYAKAALIEARYEREHGSKLRIMLFSGATLIAQYLGILLVDGFLSLGSLVSVWAYMWLMLESVFLASCGMFEIIFSLPVGMCFWVLILGQKIFWYQMLVIYMILGIGADDVFIFYDAWLQSAHAEGVSHSKSTRFCWAYRRSVGAMLVTTLTTCGSFFIGATSPLPLVQSFCIFAAVVVLVDYLFCISFFASAVLVYEEWIKGFGYCFRCCGIELREAGTCLGPGCCFGGLRACLTCCGRSWKVLPKPPKPEDPPEPRAMEKFFSGFVFRQYQNHKIKLILFWVAVVIGMATSAGLQLRTAKKRAPIGRENIDVIKGSDILFSEFEFSTRPVTASIVFGLEDETPVTWARERDDSTLNAPKFGGTSAIDLAQPQNQLELLALCTAVDRGQDDADTRCGTRACLAKGSPLPGGCAHDVEAWQTSGLYIRADESCVTSRYCFMEDLRYFWASKQGSCQGKGESACIAAAGCAYTNSTLPPSCYSTTDPLSYPGLSESEFLSLLSTASVSDPQTTEWEEYMEMKANYLKGINRRYEADFMTQYTGIRLNNAKTAIQFAWISYNATFPRENTVDEANEWYNRWQTFKETWAPDLGGFQTAELYLFLVTQNEMVKAATMGIGLSLLVCWIVLLATTWNWWTSTLGLVCIVCITATFLGIVPLLGWSLGENECIFMIATVGLSVDYTVHLLHAYNNTPARTRTDRAHAALEEMGISVANSAITTLFAAAMLFACGFYFFFQFGGFIFMVIGLSILMSTNFLMPLLMLIGPENDQGNMCCYLLARKPPLPRVPKSSE